MGCDDPGHRTLTLPISHEEINGINWFFEWWYKFGMIANSYWVRILKSVCGPF